MYNLIINSEINRLSTLNSTFPDFLGTQLTIFSTSDEQG